MSEQVPSDAPTLDEIAGAREALGEAVVTTPLAKGVFPMAHPLHMGIYIGPHSHPDIARRVHDADLVLSLGSQLTDLNLGETCSNSVSFDPFDLCFDARLPLASATRFEPDRKSGAHA